MGEFHITQGLRVLNAGRFDGLAREASIILWRAVSFGKKQISNPSSGGRVASISLFVTSTPSGERFALFSMWRMDRRFGRPRYFPCGAWTGSLSAQRLHSQA